MDGLLGAERLVFSTSDIDAETDAVTCHRGRFGPDGLVFSRSALRAVRRPAGTKPGNLTLPADAQARGAAQHGHGHGHQDLRRAAAATRRTLSADAPRIPLCAPSHPAVLRSRTRRRSTRSWRSLRRPPRAPP